MGKIFLPHNYPFAPPAFTFLTPNGRFECGTKICLSISQHHPEEWQPAWGIRAALTALQPFMCTPGEGAIGALETPDTTRRDLAAQSRIQPPQMGTPEAQEVAGRLHADLLRF